MGMIMHDDVPYGAGTSYTAGTGIAINNNIIAVDADNAPTENSEKPVKSKGIHSIIEQIYADNGVLGAKNLLPNNASTQTINGVTFTVNADGSITVNGTASAQTTLSLYHENQNCPYIGKAILSGCPSGGSSSTYDLRITDDSVSTNTDFGEGVNVSITSTGSWTVAIMIRKGQVCSNLVFYPMFRLASDPDDTYVPYAMTNRELTETINNISPALITSPMPSYVANSLPVRKKDITNDFYNGSLRAEIAAGNFANVRPGDYIIGQSSGSTYYVACLDYRLGKGDQTNNANYPAYGTHHLGLMLFKHNGPTRLWAGYGNADKSWRVSASDKGRCPWNAAADVDPTDSEAIGTNNTNITRQYNGANVSGYMGSFIRERIDEIILTEDFIADFGSANVLKYREINGNAVATDKPSGGQGNWNGCTSGWSWYDRFLDLPSEIELYGSRVFSSAYDIGCQCEQLPFLRNAAIHDFFPIIDIWTKAVASGSGAVLRDYRGHASSSAASVAAWACPLGCVK